MKNAAQFFGIRSHHRERIVPRIALVNDNIEPKIDSEIELLLKETRLSRLVSAVLDARFDLLFGLALQRARENLHFLSLCRFHARQMMIIETCFAKRDDARTFRQLP